MNQWIERITQFLPGVTVGKIQGKIDTEHPIVIGMLLSMYMTKTFKQFGFTILEKFIIQVQKIQSSIIKNKHQFRIISGKRWLTKVFKMFLGEIVHTEKKKRF